MAATDYFPNKDGYIEDGHVIGFCYADDTTMAAGSFVKFGTSRANYVAVAAATAAADSVGMCLRTPAAIGDVVPVAFMGVVKTAVHSTIAIGDLVSNSKTTITAVVEALGAYTSEKQVHNGIGGNFTARILGTAMQAGNPADEILVLLGKVC
jgi:hypothetical protein